jgi:glutathione reductase (NADPH)
MWLAAARAAAASKAQAPTTATTTFAFSFARRAWSSSSSSRRIASLVIAPAWPAATAGPRHPPFRRLAAAAAPLLARPATPPPTLRPQPALSLITTMSGTMATASMANTATTPTTTYDYDLVTIGAGSGGVRASRFAAQYYGARVACVELPFDLVSSDEKGGAGGTCVIRGCVPKKLLVYGAQFADELRDARGFGWLVGQTGDGAAASGPEPFSHDWRALIAAKTKEVARLNSVYVSLLKGAGVDYVEGRASLAGPHAVDVALPNNGGTRRLTARHILVATGGRATRLPIPGAELAVTSDEALALDALPQPPSPGKPPVVVIVGGGYIAVEFAGIFRGLGCEVHLLYRADKPLRGFDEDCRAQVAENLAARGIRLHPGTLPTRVEDLDAPAAGGNGGAAQQPQKTAGAGRFLVTLQSSLNGSNSASQLEAGLVMMATGRAPRTEGLGLEKLGVQLDAKTGAVLVDSASTTSVRSIHAIGDVTNRVNLTPVALMEGMALARTLFGGEKEPTLPDYQFVPSAVFCQPPLASCGYSEEAAVAQLSGPIDIYVSRFRPMKHTLSGRDERTLMKLVVHQESGRVVGVHMVGSDAAETLQGFAVALKAGATKAAFDGTVGIHPSAAEEFVTMRQKARTVMGTGSCKL